MGEIVQRGEGVVSSDAVFGSPDLRGSVEASLFLKRLFDLGIAGGLLVALSPVLFATAFVVFASLGRPLMIRQERCGKGRRSFVVSKFRTMSDARNAEGALLPDERRQTVVTAFLRRVRVDEL